MGYQTNQQVHSGILASFSVEATGDEARQIRVSEHQGWEISFQPLQGPKPTVISAMEIRGKTREYQKNSILLYNGLETHTEVYVSERDGVFQEQAVVILHPFLKRLLAEVGLDPDNIVFEGVEHIPSPRVKSLLCEIFQLRAVRDVSAITHECLATELALELLTQFNSTHSNYLRKAMNYGHFPTRVVRAAQMISENALDSNLSIETLAREVGVSKFHFIRSFRKHTGTTPRNYLNTVRVDLAKARLLRGNSVTSAALDSGFSSVSTFNKAFRRTTGVAPTFFLNQN